MGMLQLAGAVSGFGKGLQQGLQQTQQYMSQSMLLKERDDMERARNEITYGRELGLLQMKRGFDKEDADLAHSRALDREEQRQDFESGENRKTRAAQRENAELQAQRELEREDKRQQNTVTNKVIDASYEQQKEATKSKQDRAKEERDRQAKREELQTNSGTRLVEQMLQNQRPTAGGAYGQRLDPAIASRTKDLDLELDSLFDQKKSVMSDVVMNDEKKKAELSRIAREIAEVRNKKNKLLGQPEEQGLTPSRQPYRFPE